MAKIKTIIIMLILLSVSEQIITAPTNTSCCFGCWAWLISKLNHNKTSSPTYPNNKIIIIDHCFATAQELEPYQSPTSTHDTPSSQTFNTITWKIPTTESPQSDTKNVLISPKNPTAHQNHAEKTQRFPLEVPLLKKVTVTGHSSTSTPAIITSHHTGILLPSASSRSFHTPTPQAQDHFNQDYEEEEIESSFDEVNKSDVES